MWKPESDVVCLALVSALAITSLVSAVEETPYKNQECDPSNLDALCNDNNAACTADKTTGKFTCVCSRGHERETASGKCMKRRTTLTTSPETTTEKLDDASGSSGGSVAVGLLVPSFLIGLGILGYCAARRYKLLPCRHNLYGNVLVTRDEDDDDPPIA